MSRAEKKIDGQPAAILELEILCKKTAGIKNCTIKYIESLGKSIGTLFEPEMAFVMIEKCHLAPDTILYEIYPAGISSDTFRTYLNFALKLAASMLYLLRINKSFSDVDFLRLKEYRVLEKLINRPLRENELKLFENSRNFFKKKYLIYSLPAIALSYKIHGSFLDARLEPENTHDRCYTANNDMIFNYYSLNYEICYFSLNYKYSSLILIGGKKYEIFWLFAVSSGLREFELAGDQIRHGNQIVRIPVASRFGLGRLDETIDPFQKAVGQS